MKRREFLKVGAAAGAATAIAAPAVAQSMPEVKWRLTSSFPRQLDTIFGTAQTFARYMAEATDNRFQIQTFAGGEIVPGLQALDAVSNGTVECAHTPTYFYVGKDPTLGFGTGVPFGLNARQQHSWWYFGGGEKLVNESLAKFNVYSIPAGNSGCQMGGFFRKELNTVEDLRGLKFRIGGMGGQVMARLGVVPQQIAPGDLYPALERGTIDAAEFVGPHDDEKLGLNRVAPFYYYPGWWEGGAMLHLCINQGEWAKLPKHYQAIMFHAGTQLRPFPQTIMEASLRAANEYYAEIAGRNELFKRTLESYVAFRGESLLWWQVGELSFDAFMARTRGRS